MNFAITVLRCILTKMSKMAYKSSPLKTSLAMPHKNNSLFMLLYFMVGFWGAFVQAVEPNTDSPACERATITEKWRDRALFSGAASVAPMGKNMLWYQRPAEIWEEALPLGNGRLGAMVFGGVADERLQLNEDSLWDGYPSDATNPNALEALPEVRRLIFEDKNIEAKRLGAKKMQGTKSILP